MLWWPEGDDRTHLPATLLGMPGAGIEQEQRLSATLTKSGCVQRPGPRTAFPGIARRCNSPSWISAMPFTMTWRIPTEGALGF